MRFFACNYITVFLAWWTCVSATTDNLTDVVAWDQYSLLINGSR